MQLSEFESGFMLLRGAYGDRVFPKERETPLWKRYCRCPDGAFKAAVETIVLRMPQAGNVIEWLDDRLEVGQAPKAFGPTHDCPPCRDHGFGFAGDVVVACHSCARGRSISPAELARAQASYNAGARFTRGSGGSPLPPLPYDPKERQGA